MNKKTIIIIIIILVLALSITGILLSQNSIQVSNSTTKQSIIEITDIINIEEDIKVENIKVINKNNKWYLNIDIINNSEEEKTLTDYEVLLYDSNDNYIKTIGIDTQIVVEAKQKHTLSLENTSDISNTKRIEIVKNN